MKLVEYRIVIPVAFNKFEHAEDYAFARRIDEESNGDEGIELSGRIPLGNGSKAGYMTKKVFHYYKKIPAILRWAFSKNAVDFVEEMQSSFPHRHFSYDLPSLGDRVKMSLESDYASFDGYTIPDNLCGLSQEQLDKREVRYINIMDKGLLNGFECSEADIKKLPATSGKSDSKSIPSWVRSYNGEMTINVKVLQVETKIAGISKAVEDLLANSILPGIFMDTSVGIVKWSPDWASLDSDGVIQLENKTSEKIRKSMKYAKVA